VTRVSETGVPDEAYEAARAVFEERELVDLTIAIGLMNAYNRMAISFRNPPWLSDKEVLVKIFVAGATGAVGFLSAHAAV
jgi:hypothetical protein